MKFFCFFYQYKVIHQVQCHTLDLYNLWTLYQCLAIFFGKDFVEVMFKSCSNTVTTFSFRRRAHLLDGIEDVLVNVVLCVNGEGVVCGLVVVLEEEVLERHGVLLLEGHYHMVAEAKEHQL